MADPTRAGRRRPQTWLWMLLALICVGGFLTWLGLTSEPSTVAIVEEEGEAEDDAAAGEFVVVSKDTLASDKARFEGQAVEVPSMQATSMLGPVVFWGELGDQSNQVPILVRMDSMLAASGMTVEAGSDYRVRGVVQRMSDSIAAEWAEQGVLPDEGAQMQATFADYFIEARNIRRATQGGARDEGANAPSPPAQPEG